MRARRVMGGVALGAMAALWWWATDSLDTPRLVAPEGSHERLIVDRAPFGRQASAVVYSHHGAIDHTERSNQTFLAGWAALLSGEALLAMIAAWGLGLRIRPRGLEARRRLP